MAECGLEALEALADMVEVGAASGVTLGQLGRVLPLVGQEALAVGAHGDVAHAALAHGVEERHHLCFGHVEEGDHAVEGTRCDGGLGEGRGVREGAEIADLALILQLVEGLAQVGVDGGHGRDAGRVAALVVDDALVDAALQVLDDVDALGVELAKGGLDHVAELVRHEAVVVVVGDGGLDDVLKAGAALVPAQHLTQRIAGAVLVGRVDGGDTVGKRCLQRRLALVEVVLLVQAGDEAHGAEGDLGKLEVGLAEAAMAHDGIPVV